MKKITLLLSSSLCVACQTQPLMGGSDAVNDVDLNSVPQLSISLSDLEAENELVGTSNSFSLTTPQVPGNVAFGSYFFGTLSQRTLTLNYQRVSGDIIFAYVWYFNSHTKAFQVLNQGWHYNKSNPSLSYQGDLTLPNEASHIYVGFFSARGGSVNASLKTTVNTSTYSKESIFRNAMLDSPTQLGLPTTGIIQSSTPKVWKQEFTQGAILWREGSAKAWSLPEPFWSAWKTTGNMTVYGLPTSNVTTGRTLNNRVSSHQLYEGANAPSLHSSSIGTYRFYQQTRDLWNQNGNYDRLGHPTNDAENNSQSFEKGSIRNGVISINGTTPVSDSKWRSADFQNAWERLGTLDTPEISNGRASHLSPAEIIYYSAKENSINPVLLIAKLQDEQSLITQSKNWGTTDFEWRLARACGYGATDSGDIKTTTYYGFFPQLVSTSYQFEKNRKAYQGSFQRAYASFTTGSGKYTSFINTLYPKYAKEMNRVAQKNYSEWPSDLGYFKDFRDISVQDIQRFLDLFDGALKEKDLFRQPGFTNSRIQYL